jgi:hypothetical protein
MLSVRRPKRYHWYDELVENLWILIEVFSRGNNGPEAGVDTIFLSFREHGRTGEIAGRFRRKLLTCHVG